MGLITALVITALPMAGDYYTNQLLSGSPKTTMIGNTIYDQFNSGNNWPLGSAMSVLLMAFILVGVFIYLRRVGDDAL